MYNSVELIGNVGKKPEVRTTEKSKVVSFSLATSESFGKGDDKKTVTQWHNIVAWDKLAEIIEKYVDKGDKLFIRGKLQHRSYDAKDGTKRYITEVVAREMVMLGDQKKDSVKEEEKSEQADTTEPIDDLPFN